jgi:hypothetical protein
LKHRLVDSDFPPLSILEKLREIKILPRKNSYLKASGYPNQRIIRSGGNGLERIEKNIW